VLVHRPKYDDWTLPKGKLEPGEELPAAAVREVREETGLDCVLGPALGDVEYVDSSGSDKTVDYWAAAAARDGLAPTKEIDEARWLSFEEAGRLLSHERDREVVRRAAALLPDVRGPVPVQLVRHARAGRRDRRRGRDELRPLTGTGWAQAGALARSLAAGRPAVLVSSPAVRCVQTLEPLGDVLGVPVQRHEALAEGACAEAALDLLEGAAVLGEVVACTHGDVQAAVIEALAAAEVPISRPLRFAKGSTWELTLEGGRFTTGRYVPPP
jgi:8-oxo-(d)GTP phosphatase